MKPYIFQSGFVANRIAREQRELSPGAAIEVVAVKTPGQMKELKDGSFVWVGVHGGFMLEKTEGEAKTYYVSLEDGFHPIEEEAK
jgi:hypothetical protein